MATKNLHAGRLAYSNQQYEEAIEKFKTVLSAFPSSENAKLELAKTYCKKQSPENYFLALDCLEGIKLKKINTFDFPQDFKQFVQNNAYIE